VIVPENFNTDAFGTFTREIKRPDTQIITAKLKAQKALEVTGETIAIASEGSFAPHPSFPYVYANREIMVFLDQENELEIIGEVFSLDTNFNHQVVDNLASAEEFALKVGFPEHGLVIWFEDVNNSQNPQIIKGITTIKELQKAVNFAVNNAPDGHFHIETDMRALYNPTRMKNIEKATQDLLNKINSSCPKCHTPGFTITEKITGLPCELCQQPTLLTMAVIYQCGKCNFIEKKLYPEGKNFADPGLCEYCNP
jgi:ribosomal protein S27AE